MVPVQRVGLYVPGGIAPLVSSVVMNVVPAQVAGRRVDRADLARPQKEHGGLPHPTILAACALLGIDEVYAVGGAQAIAMFAYGAGPCRQVDLVTGPGNIYTVAAKRLLKGVVGIDSEAGPTEIAILADDTADAGVRRRRPDQPGRARPDGRRACWSPPRERLADDVEAELDKQVLASPGTSSGSAPRCRRPAVGHRAGRRPRAGARRRRRLRRRAPRDPDRATPPRWPRRVRNAGAIFVGPFAPVSLGDYCAGSNHVLPDRRLRLPLLRPVGAGVPQGGARRRLRRATALRRGGRPRRTLAEAEDLPGHGAAVRVRVAAPSEP